jgi:C_GCAxxG_C_C family probable redox protein
MMDRAKHAMDFFDKKANCAQSVLWAFASDYGMDEKTALRVATGFGGGMGRMANVCGAVTGAYMALGLARGMSSLGEQEKKTAVYGLVREFTRRFTEKNSSILCKDLLGFDISTEEGHSAAVEKGLFKSTCPALVGDAVKILEAMLVEKAK